MIANAPEKLTDAERVTIMAGLRLLKSSMPELFETLTTDEKELVLSEDEIDELLEKINS